MVKKCSDACPIHASKSQTKFGWILSNGLGGDSVTDKQTDLTPKHPQVPTLGHDPGDQMKIPTDMFYIFYLCEGIQSLVKKSLKLTL